jgi:hypothetical protein
MFSALTGWLLVSDTLLVTPPVRTIREPNETLDGASATGGTPVPLRLTICGLLFASSLMVIAPPRVPMAEGLKLTLIAQLAGARLELHPLLFRMKSPLVATFVILRFLNRLLITSAGCTGLIVPTT